jgi:transposase
LLVSIDSLENENKQHIGVSRGEKTTKVHAIVDALSNPIHVHLSAGNLHDPTEAETSLANVPLERGIALADKAYGSSAIRTFIEKAGGGYCIPPSRMIRIRGIAIGGCTKSVIWWSVSFRNSSYSVELPRAMRNSPNGFLPSFSLTAL